jgi:phage gp46-like protein
MVFTPYKRPVGYNFDGEPRLIVTDNGTTIEVRGGQPVMDAGLENAILISLFTDAGWWGNQYVEPEYHLGDSKFESIISGTITKTTFVQAEGEAKRSLKWLIDEGLSSEIIAKVSNRDGIGIDVDITVVRPNGDEQQISLRRYGTNWIRQGEDPASARLTDDY